MPDTSHFLRDYNWLEENKPEDVRFGDIVVLFFLVNVDIVVLSFLVNVDIVVLFFFSNLEVVGLISLVRFNSVILTADHDVLTPTALQQLAQLHHKVMFVGTNFEGYFLGLHFETNNKIEKTSRSELLQVVSLRTSSNLGWSDVCFEIPAKVEVEAPEASKQTSLQSVFMHCLYLFT